MAKNKPRTVLYRRKREQKTNYKKRLQLLLSKRPRLCVRFTNQRIIAQVVIFETKGDKVVAGVDSSALVKEGWNYSLKNYPAAYLTGLLIAKRALAAGVTQAILDTGFKSPLQKGKVYSLLKGALDGGLEVPHGEGMFPSDERISGQHIKDYASTLGENKEVYGKRFATYLKNNVKPEQIVDTFNQIKNKIGVKNE